MINSVSKVWVGALYGMVHGYDVLCCGSCCSSITEAVGHDSGNNTFQIQVSG
jgi:hypothetical protein